MERTEGAVPPGALVNVADGAGTVIGWGAYNPDSMFRVRLLWHASEGRLPTSVGSGKTTDADHLAAVLELRLRAAVGLRQRLGLPGIGTTAYRLVNSEGDRLSGLVVDVFGATAVVSSGAIW